MKKTINIGTREVGEGCAPYIIAEACINHDGNIAIAREMVFHARAQNCDAIKFQLHVLDDEMLRDAPISENFDEPLYETLDKTNLSVGEHKELKALCAQIGIDYICTPFSKVSANILDDEIGVDVFKVGSGELTNIPLQRHIASKGKPMIVSTGMSELHEVEETVNALLDSGADFALTHCVSAYPCPYDRVNLGVIPKYRKMFNVPVGLSDHSVGIYTSLGAVALGACIIEKHFTLDRTSPGPDHMSSIEAYELGELIKGCRAVFLAGGDKREIFPEEKEIIAWARESVVSVIDIAAGAVITNEMVTVKRPSPRSGAIAAKSLEEIVGRTAKVDIASDRQLLWSDID